MAYLVCPRLTAIRLKRIRLCVEKDTSGLHLNRVRPSHSFTPSPALGGKVEVGIPNPPPGLKIRRPFGGGLAPGCKHFGHSVFADCCSMSQVGVEEDATNSLAPQAQVSSHAFESCRALLQINFENTEANPWNCTRYIPVECFLGSGIVQMELPADSTS